VATRQRSYLAKSAKPNRIGLVDPPCNTAVAFVPGSSATKVLPFVLLQFFLLAVGCKCAMSGSEGLPQVMHGGHIRLGIC
jgi:hypothetical protein